MLSGGGSDHWICKVIRGERESLGGESGARWRGERERKTQSLREGRRAKGKAHRIVSEGVCN